MDMGESLVGAYMRQVRGCHTVAYNTFLPWGQGELDVIGVALPENDGPVRVWLAEVALHLDGLNYGSYAQTAVKVQAKVACGNAVRRGDLSGSRVSTGAVVASGSEGTCDPSRGLRL